MAQIKRLVVHCSDSKWGDAAVIREWHKQRGWKDIGYNAVILNGQRTSRLKYLPQDDGLLELGRGLNLDNQISPEEVGAHAMGYNSESIGVCLIGVAAFTTKQLQTLEAFCALWARIVPGIQIVGHYELDPRKTCPNLNMDLWRKRLAHWMLDFKGP